jgi:hypothetical protein
MEQAQPPPEKEKDRPWEVEQPRVVVEITFRCPFCHHSMAVGDLAAHCDACSAPHHLACFAERSGCSAAGCDGQTANARKLALPQRERCATCRSDLGEADWVARCGCGALSHAACFEGKKSCGNAACNGLARVATLAMIKHEAWRANAGLVPFIFGMFTMFSAAGLIGAIVEYVHERSRFTRYGYPFDTTGALIGGAFAIAGILLFGLITVRSILHIRRKAPPAPPPRAPRDAPPKE